MIYIILLLICAALIIGGILYLMKSVNSTITAIVIGMIIIGLGSTFIDENAGKELMKLGGFICTILIAVGIGKLFIKK